MKNSLIKLVWSTFFSLLVFSNMANANNRKDESKKVEPAFSASTLSGLTLRNIGPGLMSGRISDIALHPENENIWYVAAGSGGVWKTENSGTTWQPLFDNENVYSIGSITLDPQNPNAIWIGTGENVGGRHVSFGDGVYRSLDGGKNWENMGLKESQHISKIIIHPKHSKILWVAAQGPLWNKGGERGLYKSVDGGKTWKQTLGDDKWTGVTDLVIDPRNPDRLYAATWQRHRNVAAYMGGGPNSGLHRSEDGGDTWTQLKDGLPTTNMGKIGIALSPQKPDILYAAIELDRRTGSVYRSDNRGQSWQKQSDAVSGATGPHYYQELYASPHQFDKIYLVDVRTQVSEDGGKSFSIMKEKHKHSDNHAIAFRENDPNYLLVGTDGGLYESFDDTENWRFVSNLPITQFYKIALDDSEPFYNIYGGTQDNNTQGGPSRTDNYHGITNRDWYITLFGDGHQPATEPGNPNIVYSEWQQGNLVRVDKTTGEFVYIQPQPAKNEKSERFNWDAPILVSPHSPTRLYFASHRVWRSDNRGDEWRAVSTDLTKNQSRLTLPIMGQQWSWDATWDVLAMSNYNTITSLAESPIQEGLLYAGTDDGQFSVSDNGGDRWKTRQVDDISGVPASAFVNDIKADLFDKNTVYMVLDNHKFGDFKPYVFKSTNRGKSWKNIASNLPEKTIAWRIIQDHVNKNLLFLGTEFGLYVSVDSGKEWVQLKGDVPTIAFRDLAIHKRENDLVAASFGRGIYILDDYSPLRTITRKTLDNDALLFEPRKAWWYIERPQLGFGRDSKGAQGAGFYAAPNPPFGAVFTYYLKEDILTLKDQRKREEEKRLKKNKAVAFKGWDTVNDEKNQIAPSVWLTVKDSDKNIVRRLKASTKKGLHRIAWDLTFPTERVINIKDLQEKKSDNNTDSGFLAAPGTYTVSLSKRIDGKEVQLSPNRTFTVEPLRTGHLKGQPLEKVAAFWKELSSFQRELTAFESSVSASHDKINLLLKSFERSTSQNSTLVKSLHDITQQLDKIEYQLHGNSAKEEIGAPQNPTILSRLDMVITGNSFSTYGPTKTHLDQFSIAKELYQTVKADYLESVNRLKKVESELYQEKAPFVESQSVIMQ